MMFYVFIALCFASFVRKELLSLPGCPSECGNLTIPFPFGVTSDCSFDDTFHIICDRSFEPPKPFLRLLSMEVAAISLDGKLELLNSSSSSSSSNLVEEESEGEILRMVVDWAAGDAPCHVAQTNGSRYACQSPQSQCLDSSTGQGHVCRCLPGYQGNPYLADGCLDIDECAISNPCEGVCVNLRGSFKCYCPKGLVGDGRRDGTACSHAQDHINWSAVSVLLLIGIFVVAPIVAINFGNVKSNVEQSVADTRGEHFERNGGNLLRRKLSRRNPELEIYTPEYVKSFTNNYTDKIVAPICTPEENFYVGTLRERRVIVATVEIVLPNERKRDFVDELMFLSKPHANLVRVLGCCLETPSLIIVYELHGKWSTTLCNLTRLDATPLSREVRPLSREVWVAVAAGVAKGIAHFDTYKYFATFVHGDICSANILMDDSNVPKIFYAVGSNLRTTRLTGSENLYADPNPLNKKTDDVYSFGVVLVELLTRRIPIPEHIHKAQRNELFNILDEEMTREEVLVRKVAALARGCLDVRPNKRPKMKKVSKKLNSLMRI